MITKLQNKTVPSNKTDPLSILSGFIPNLPKENQNEAHQALEEIRRMLGTDNLTGLGNKQKFDSEIKIFVQKCLRFGQAGSLLFIDLDNLHYLNRILGSDAVDKIIKDIVDNISSSIRDIDAAFRRSGDEFLVLLPGTDVKNAQNVINRICSKVSAIKVTYDGKDIPIGVSIGVSSIPANTGTPKKYTPEDITNIIQTLLTDSENGMKKEKGKKPVLADAKRD